MDEEDLSKQQKDLGEPSSYRKVQAFIETFRKRTDTTTGNILAFSFSKWHRYCYFLTLIMGRAEKASANFIVDMERSLEAAKASPGQRPMTPEEIEALNNSFYLGQNLHLEIESFYIFAKVLLDRIADTFGYYFGVKWRGFGSTHNKLTLQFQEICSKIDLQVEPADLRELLSDLRKRIVDYRTRDIEHVSDPRLLHATSWGVDKKAKISTIVVHPFEPGFPRHEQKETEDLDELMGLFERYISTMVDFFELNSEKSILRSVKHPED